MKRLTTLLITGALIAALLTACGQPGGAQTQTPAPGAGNTPNGAAQTTDGQGADNQNTDDGSIDISQTLGEGIRVNYTVNDDEAEMKITGVPVYGDKRSPYVYGELTKGDPFAYELITIIIVNGNYYGKKPFNNSPNGFIKSDGTFSVQFSSNDGQGTDWNAESIFIFLVPSGYEDEIEPDVSAGYVVAPSQVASLKNNSVCVVQIDREIPMS